MATKLKLAGANHLIMPEEIAGLLGAVYIGQPVAFDALQSILTRKRSSRIDEVEVKMGSFLDGGKVSDFDFVEAKLVLLAILKPIVIDGRQESHYVIFNPPDDTGLTAGDILVVLGYNISIADFKARIEQSVRFKHKRS